MPISLGEAKARIDKILNRYAAITRAGSSVLSEKLTAGKLYEAWVLAGVLENFRKREGYDVTLIGSDKVRLKSSPGPINRRYPHFLLRRPHEPDLEVWTDVEFVAMSHAIRRERPIKPTKPTKAEYHELDIVVVPAGMGGRPPHDAVRLAVECKNINDVDKQVLRTALGVRRELSRLTDWTPTGFRAWPTHKVRADPPSVLAVYSTDPAVGEFSVVGDMYGIQFVHEPIELITYGRGPLTDTNAEALVIAVTTGGAVRTKTARSFRRSHPRLSTHLSHAAKTGQLRIGSVKAWPTSMSGASPQYIITVPIKRRRRAKADLADVEAGLRHLVDVVRHLDIPSLAIPDLGCRRDGLDWHVLEPRIRAALEPLPDVRIEIFPPD